MVADAEANKEEDRRRAELAQARNTAESSIHQVRKTLKDLGEKVDGADRAACETAINDLEEAVKGEDKDLITKRTDALMTAAQKIGEKLNQQQAQPGAQQEAPKSQKKDDDVVDADFKEV